MLEVDDLSKTYGETVALDGVRIAFAPATIHAILGENGSGKSTLVKLLSGVVPPSRGAIRVDGRAIDRHSPGVFQALGVATVFQEVLIAPDRSALDNIFLGRDGLFRRRVSAPRQSKLAAEVLSSIANTKFDLETPAAPASGGAAAGRAGARSGQASARPDPGRSHSGAGLRRSRVCVSDDGGFFSSRRPHPVHFAPHGRSAAPCASRDDPAQRKGGGYARPVVPFAGADVEPNGPRGGRGDGSWTLKPANRLSDC